ncbi:cell wall hydrolase [Cereibacter sphaeroides]|uniref:cell wall hydrolase n=1 Tax=Cereibacter sphaeroides TaxID=1063 RepID=UPI001F3FEE10|nr:cell wall hydrolase [Cereibacter sphaeroides]MCE6961199.1 cell wall hydrolase [Cereibacter sphaeroides]MCE6970185.1 cell wall hydrolase [Cereibacter sphaeroides]MCE6974076.1 cell wall hydrolase [Cereibacter sphaeroides]
MRLLDIWMRGAAALMLLSGAAFADVTVSQSNDPAGQFGGQLSALLGAERNALGTLPVQRLEAMASAVKRPGKNEKPSKATPATLRYDEAWLASQPAPAKGSDEWKCLATALYFEARGESIQGQFAVAEVILNRVDRPGYPQSICGVVNQGGQFSYTFDGRPDTIRERAAFQRSGKIAALMLDGAPRKLTQGATHFHTRAVRPGWAHRFPRTAVIGAHLFYRQPGA